MAVPTYGAAPLAKTFLINRGHQLVCFIGIIAITANFIGEIVSTNHIAPKEIIGTVTVASLSALYCLITIPFFWSNASLGLLIMGGVDFLLLIAFVVVTVVVGKPLATLNCHIISGDPADLFKTTDAYDFTQSLTFNVNKYGNFVSWSGASRGNCFQSKAAWGMCIALCILFTCSALLLPALFAKKKRAAKNGEKV